MTEITPRSDDPLEIPAVLDRRPKMFEPLSPQEQAAQPTAAVKKPDKVPIVPVPENAPPMQFQHPVYGVPDGTWPYHDAQGRLVGYVCRWNFTNQKGEPSYTRKLVMG